MQTNSLPTSLQIKEKVNRQDELARSRSLVKRKEDLAQTNSDSVRSLRSRWVASRQRREDIPPHLSRPSCSPQPRLASLEMRFAHLERSESGERSRACPARAGSRFAREGVSVRRHPNMDSHLVGWRTLRVYRMGYAVFHPEGCPDPEGVARRTPSLILGTKSSTSPSESLAAEPSHFDVRTVLASDSSIWSKAGETLRSQMRQNSEPQVRLTSGT